MLIIVQVFMARSAHRWAESLEQEQVLVFQDRRCAELLAFKKNILQARAWIKFQGQEDGYGFRVTEKVQNELLASCKKQDSIFTVVEQHQQTNCPNWWVRYAGQQ